MKMMRTARTLVVGAGTFLAASIASADLLVAEPVTAPYDNAQATVEFTGSEAGYTGEFYYLGSGNATSVTNPAPDTGPEGLGQYLFNNHSSATGANVLIPELFSNGDVLHFGYRVTEPEHGIDLFRTDVSNDVEQFAFDPQSGAFGVEDLRFPNSDGDYNDAAFNVSFSQVPGPSALAAIAVALVLRRGRRRAAHPVTA